MADKKQLAILKQGVDVWNQWRDDENIDHPNLTKADLQSLSLKNANFHQVDFSEANLEEADLNDADFSKANLKRANLRNSNLTNAYLWKANLNGTFLTNANLYEAKLIEASLYETILDNTNIEKATLGNTRINNTDLRLVAGLEYVRHYTPSSIGVDTLYRFRGEIPIDFLRGCGLSDLDIEYAKLANPDLSAQEVSEITHRIFELKDTRPIQISPLFISYSHANSAFTDKLETKLNEKGIRFWRDIHDATAGRLETQIDRAIRHNPTVLLILSEHSTSSDWVEHEARLARKLEKDLGRDVLCPIALDDSWKTCNWPERIKEQIMEYNILDFSNWEDEDELDAMFKRLIDGLDMFYKK